MATVTVIKDMVINRCHGGFGLSMEALRAYAARKGIRLHFSEPSAYHVYRDAAFTQYFSVDDIPRDDPDLIDIVRTLGRAASGESAKLDIVSVRIEVDISAHDGYEQVSAYCHPV